MDAAEKKRRFEDGLLPSYLYEVLKSKSQSYDEAVTAATDFYKLQCRLKGIDFELSTDATGDPIELDRISKVRDSEKDTGTVNGRAPPAGLISSGINRAQALRIFNSAFTKMNNYSLKQGRDLCKKHKNPIYKSIAKLLRPFRAIDVNLNG